MSEPAALLLIVDDEPRILSALRRSLRREPFEVLAVETCREALQLLDEHPVDIVLSDFKMPGMTGLQLLAEAAARRPGAVRLLITGWTEEIPAAEIEALGVFGVLNKPWEDAELKDMLHAARKAGEQQPEPDPGTLPGWPST